MFLVPPYAPYPKTKAAANNSFYFNMKAGQNQHLTGIPSSLYY